MNNDKKEKFIQQCCSLVIRAMSCHAASWVSVIKQPNMHTLKSLQGFQAFGLQIKMDHNEGRRTEGNNIAVSLCDFSESPSIPRGSPVGTASPETAFNRAFDFPTRPFT